MYRVTAWCKTCKVSECVEGDDLPALLGEIDRRHPAHCHVSITVHRKVLTAIWVEAIGYGLLVLMIAACLVAANLDIP